MEHLNLKREVQLESWIDTLKEISHEFPSQNTSINTVIKSFKSQLKELKNKQ